MAKLLTGTRVYGTANVDNILTVGNITPVNSTSNTTGSLVVTGGVGVTGNIFLSSANTYGSTESFRLGWTDNYFARNSTYGGVYYNGTFLAIQTGALYIEGGAAAIIRSSLQNDIGDRRVTIKDNTGLNVANIATSTSNTTGALIVAGGVGISGNTWSSGKMTVGNSIAIPNINNIVNTAVAIGLAGYRSFNLVDTAAVMKIARLGGDSALELQSWDATGVTNNSYYDFVAINSASTSFSIRDRRPSVGGTANRFTIANTGEISIPSTTVSTSNTTGALTVSGGVGVLGNLYADAIYDSGVELLSYFGGIDTTQNTRMTLIEGTNSTQNTNLSATNGKMESAYSQANTAITNVSATNGKMESAYSQANTGSNFVSTGGTITGNVIITKNLTVTGNLSVLGNSTVFSTGQLDIGDSLIYLANNNFTSDVVDIGIIAHYANATGGSAHTGIFRDPSLKEWIFFQGYTPEVQSNNLINISDPSFAYANVYANLFKGNVIASGYNLFNYTSAAYTQANTATTNASATNGKMESAYTQANTAVTNVSATNGKMESAYTQANTAITNASATNGKMESAYSQANTGTVLAQAAFNTSNVQIGINSTQNTNITIIQGVDSGQNTAIAATDGKMQSAYNQANTDYTTLSASSGTYGSSSLIPVITLSANGRVTSITTTSVSGGGGGGTTYLANSVIFSDSTGTLSNTSNLSYTSSTNTLKSNGTFVLGNTTTTNTASMVYNATLNSIDFIFN